MPNRITQTVRAALVTPLVCTVLLLVTSISAQASCIPPVGVAAAMTQADVVVVGTVTSARSGDRIVTVRVEERWKGDIARTIEVFGGPVTGATSVDRTYEVGARYLLFVREAHAHGEAATFGGRYEDNACSTTQRWTETLAQYRPADATVYAANRSSVTKSPKAHASRAPAVGLALAAVVVVAAVGVWAQARRRTAAP